MKFITVTNVKGILYLNPLQIEVIVDSELLSGNLYNKKDYLTTAVFCGGHYHYIQETIEQVFKKIEEAA